ncbi:MAG: hypothetical protein JWM33_3308 [Caulobacteraceae bacterium]|nr:hypothetical protein [Caulobacteraceae bacterium]
MTPEILSLLAGGGLVVGSGAAQINGPLSCGWPASGDELMLRMKALGLRRPGFTRGLLGGALVMLLLGGGTLAAYAAAPAAPSTAQALPADLDRLSKEAAGVVGSGDRLSLQIKPVDGQASRTIKVGEEYSNGWKLDAVTPTLATLSKGGETRQVGLNPTGAVARPIAFVPLSSVEVALTPSEEAELAGLIATGHWDGKILPGLSMAESQRHVLFDGRMQALGRGSISGPLAAVVGAPRAEGIYYPSELVLREVFGDAAIDHMAAENDRIREARLASQKADIAARPITGPSSYYVPAGAVRAQVRAEAGIDARGVWVEGPRDANGGVTYRRAGEVEDATTLTIVADQYEAQLKAARAAMGGRLDAPGDRQLGARPPTCGAICPWRPEL